MIMKRFENFNKTDIKTIISNFLIENCEIHIGHPTNNEKNADEDIKSIYQTVGFKYDRYEEFHGKQLMESIFKILDIDYSD